MLLELSIHIPPNAEFIYSFFFWTSLFQFSDCPFHLSMYMSEVQSITVTFLNVCRPFYQQPIFIFTDKLFTRFLLVIFLLYCLGRQGNTSFTRLFFSFNNWDVSIIMFIFQRGVLTNAALRRSRCSFVDNHDLYVRNFNDMVRIYFYIFRI